MYKNRVRYHKNNNKYCDFYFDNNNVFGSFYFNVCFNIVFFLFILDKMTIIINLTFIGKLILFVKNRLFLYQNMCH